MLTFLQPGLVDHRGPWDGSFRKNRRAVNEDVVTGAPLGEGGTKHAGHVNWKTVISPVYISDSMGIAKPSRYVMNSVVERPSNRVSRKKGITGLRKPPLTPLGPGNNSEDAPSNPNNPPRRDEPKPEPDTQPVPSTDDMDIDVPAQYVDVGATSNMGRADSSSAQLNLAHQHVSSALQEAERARAEAQHTRRELANVTELLKHSQHQTFESRGRLAKVQEELEQRVKASEFHEQQLKQAQQNHHSEMHALKDQMQAAINAIRHDASISNDERERQLLQIQKEHMEKAEAQMNAKNEELARVKKQLLDTEEIMAHTKNTSEKNYRNLQKARYEAEKLQRKHDELKLAADENATNFAEAQKYTDELIKHSEKLMQQHAQESGELQAEINRIVNNQEKTVEEAQATILSYVEENEQLKAQLDKEVEMFHNMLEGGQQSFDEQEAMLNQMQESLNNASLKTLYSNAYILAKSTLAFEPTSRQAYAILETLNNRTQGIDNALLRNQITELLMFMHNRMNQHIQLASPPQADFQNNAQDYQDAVVPSTNYNVPTLPSEVIDLTQDDDRDVEFISETPRHHHHHHQEVKQENPYDNFPDSTIGKRKRIVEGDAPIQIRKNPLLLNVKNKRVKIPSVVISDDEGAPTVRFPKQKPRHLKKGNRKLYVNLNVDPAQRGGHAPMERARQEMPIRPSMDVPVNDYYTQDQIARARRDKFAAQEARIAADPKGYAKKMSNLDKARAAKAAKAARRKAKGKRK